MEKKQDVGQFSLLTEQEIAARFFDISRFGELITLWIKGSTEKFQFRAKGYNKNQLLLELIVADGKNSSVLFNQKVLATSAIKSLQYFYSGKFTFDKVNQVYLLKISENVYKFERRKNFRLSTYPDHSVKIYLKLPEDFLPPSNVVKFDARGDQTKLFKAFLTMINHVDDNQKKVYQANFRVQDISISGLSFIVGELERQFLFENEMFLTSLLEFNCETYEIPKVKIVHLMDYIDPSKPGTRLFKVGLEFINLPVEIDNELSKQISKELRESDADKIFEDFIK